MNSKTVVPKPVPRSANHNESFKDVLDKKSKVDNSEPTWIFSFQYFKRIDKFCFGHEYFSDSWMATLFDRLSLLSKEKIKDIVEGSHQVQSSWKWHKINWNAKNIPLTRDEINWVPEGIPAEEFYQIKIHDGAGRMIGFFVRETFNVVLIDSMHNMQPSKRVHHKIRAADLIDCRFDKLEHKLLVLKKKIDSLTPDELKKEIKAIMEDEMLIDFSAKVIEISPTFHPDIDKIMEENNLESYADAIEHALTEYILSKE